MRTAKFMTILQGLTTKERKKLECCGSWICTVNIVFSHFLDTPPALSRLKFATRSSIHHPRIDDFSRETAICESRRGRFARICHSCKQ